MEQTFSPTKRKLLRVICHAAALTSWSAVVIGAPIAVLIISEDPLVKDSAREAINYSLTVLIIVGLLLALCLTIIGIPFAILGYIVVAVASTILPIIAIVTVCVDSDKPFRYPCILRIIPSESIAKV
jgi:uncharacterized Tic20 family protein